MRILCVLLALSGLWMASVAARARAGENWPQWRGPQGDGSSDAKNLPTTWSLEKNQNIVWKQELPSWSGGTPVIWGDSIFVTSPSKSEGGSGAAGGPAPPPKAEPKKEGPGKFGPPGGFKGKGGKGYGRMRDPGGQKLLLVCLSKRDGSVRWQRELDEGNQVYNKQNSSSPSPVTDGQTVWVVTGNGVVTALDFDGKVLWQRKLQEEYGRFGLNWGYGSSPLLFEGKLIIEVLHGNNTDDPSYLVAIDGASGKTLWRKERPTDAVRESPDAYTTPVVARVEGQPQIVVLGGDYVTAHDPNTGEEIWRCGGLNPDKAGNYRTIASPLVVGNVVIACAPQKRMPVIAVKTGGRGDVTASHTLWRYEEPGSPDVPTPASDGKLLYLIGDRGLATCLELATGKKVWGPERLNIGADISASPLLADGKIYITGENAVTAVFAAGPEFKPLALNDLDGSFTLSSIAVSGQHLFIRTSTHLYCIGEKAGR
jgi:outer membrane protein assembly factor BamB